MVSTTSTPERRRFRPILVGSLCMGLAATVFLALRSLSPTAIVVDPPFASASEADWLAGDDLVLGVFLDGVAKAYPVPAIAPLEYLNDRVGRRPIGVSW